MFACIVAALLDDKSTSMTTNLLVLTSDGNRIFFSDRSPDLPLVTAHLTAVPAT